MSENIANTEIEPFVGKNFLKEPEGICEYNGIQAGCNQLLVYLYRKDARIVSPTKEDVLYLDEVIATIRENGGYIIGQIKELAMIQVEIKPKEKLLYLKIKLEQSGHVQLIAFNIISKFEKK